VVEKIKLHFPFEDEEFRTLESNLKLIADKAEREHALQGIENLKKSYLIAENESAKIHQQQIQNAAPPSKIKLFF
jgi:hypothetical protein